MRIALTIAVLILAGLVQNDGARAQDAALTVLITGSSRGIGFEFARQYADKGWTVIATCRTPETADALQNLAVQYSNITIEQLDVTDHEAIESLAARYEGRAIDVLLNNAGINPGRGPQTFGEIDYEVFDQIIHTNTTGPLKMAEAFADHVAASDQKKIMTLTSGMGTLSGAERFPPIVGPYRISKAGVNMAMRVAARALKGRGVIVGILDPGLVDTDQAAGVNVPKMAPEVAIAGMITVIDGFTLEKTGLMFRHNGEVSPW